MKKVIITTSSFGRESRSPMEKLAEHGMKSIVNPYCRKLTEGELHNLLLEHKPVGFVRKG